MMVNVWTQLEPTTAFVPVVFTAKIARKTLKNAKIWNVRTMRPALGSSAYARRVLLEKNASSTSRNVTQIPV